MDKKHSILPTFLKRKHEKPNPEVKVNKLELMITVVERKKSDKFISIFQEHNAHVSMVVLGRGTAPTELLNLLGIAESSKDVILSVISESLIEPLYEEIKDVLKNEGRGISFTIPMSSMVGVTMYKFLTHVNEKKEGTTNG